MGWISQIPVKMKLGNNFFLKYQNEKVTKSKYYNAKYKKLSNNFLYLTCVIIYLDFVTFNSF